MDVGGTHRKGTLYQTDRLLPLAHVPLHAAVLPRSDWVPVVLFTEKLDYASIYVFAVLLKLKPDPTRSELVEVDARGEKPRVPNISVFVDSLAAATLVTAFAVAR